MHNNIHFNIELIIDEYTTYVYKVIDNAVDTKLTKEDKEEVISDAFYLFWKNQDKINSNIKLYLAKIARNCAYKKIKEKQYHWELTDTMITNDLSNDMTTNLIMKEKLELLTAEEKNIFTLFYVAGYKTKEIAKIMRKSNGSIKIGLHRIRNKLKEERYEC